MRRAITQGDARPAISVTNNDNGGWYGLDEKGVDTQPPRRLRLIEDKRGGMLHRRFRFAG